jgi:K+ transporter
MTFWFHSVEQPMNRALTPTTASGKKPVLGAWLVEAWFVIWNSPTFPPPCAPASPWLSIDPAQASYFLGRRVIRTSAKSALPFWQQRIFIMLANQSARAIEFFRIPPDRVVELGMQMSV